MEITDPAPHPHAHYSAGRWLLSQLYIVGWPEFDVVKIGITSNGRERYGPFLARGAEMLLLSTYPFGDNLNEEQRMRELLSLRWPPAFESKEESMLMLGRRGSGWMECYRIPVDEWGGLVAELGQVG